MWFKRSVDRQIAPSCETTVLKINYFIQINPTDTGGCMCYTPLAEGDQKPSPAV